MLYPFQHVVETPAVHPATAPEHAMHLGLGVRRQGYVVSLIPLPGYPDGLFGKLGNITLLLCQWVFRAYAAESEIRLTILPLY